MFARRGSLRGSSWVRIRRRGRAYRRKRGGGVRLKMKATGLIGVRAPPGDAPERQCDYRCIYFKAIYR